MNSRNEAWNSTPTRLWEKMRSTRTTRWLKLRERTLRPSILTELLRPKRSNLWGHSSRTRKIKVSQQQGSPPMSIQWVMSPSLTSQQQQQQRTRRKCFRASLCSSATRSLSACIRCLSSRCIIHRCSLDSLHSSNISLFLNDSLLYFCFIQYLFYNELWEYICYRICNNNKEYLLLFRIGLDAVGSQDYKKWLRVRREWLD